MHSFLCIPSATYRLQFNDHFTFQQTLEFISYFHELGISDLYASPLMKAVPHSLHGYDVVDCHQLNPEIGTEEELEKIVKVLHQLGMGLIADIVPNHMSIAGSENKWWQDVLENGPSSLYAKHFNIIWNPLKIELKNKILLAILDEPYGKVIENQELQVVYDAGAFFIEYKDQRFPLNPRTWPMILNKVIHHLSSKLKKDAPDLLELQSLIGSLELLPVNLEKYEERNEQKKWIKQRLSLLVDTSPLVKEALQASMNELNGEKGNSRSFDDLERLLDSQAYRLSFWRVSNEEINYRRFFDMSNLVSMRVEQDETFEAMHEFILQFIKKGWITGLRIDHVDGLFDPQHYFIKLQQACLQVHGGEPQEQPNRHFYLIAEKILTGGEQLRPEWLVFGTTGYDYLNLLNGLFVVKENETKIKRIYDHFIGHHHQDMIDLFYKCKKLILTVSMSSDLHILARDLEQLCEEYRGSRDYTLECLRIALRDVIASFPVYRTYICLNDADVREEDREVIQIAIQRAKYFNPSSEHSIVDFIQSILLLEDPPGLTEEQIFHRRNFVMRFQQLTGSVTARGEEDTAFYRDYPLASLNEVGMDPARFGTSIDEFHASNLERLQKWPHTLLTTSTHDTKRSEDVRARVNVLSEDPEGWQEVLNRWHQWNERYKIVIGNRKVPDNNEEYLLYQTLIGSWPLYPMNALMREQYVDRIEKYFLKALKEAKIHTSWINPHEDYEKGVLEFVRQILNSDGKTPFLKDFEKFISPIIKGGMFNSLSQIVLKMTSPGVPDFYQGNELWEFNLVDPDNRHPVDYFHRRNLLKSVQEKSREDPALFISQLMETPEDGRIKLYLTSKILNFRRQHIDLFQQGEYIPLRIEGEKTQHVVAFSRRKDEKRIIVVSSRFYTKLCLLDHVHPLGKIWEKTIVHLPDSLNGNYCDLLTGVSFSFKQNQLLLEEVFSKFPFVVLSPSCLLA